MNRIQIVATMLIAAVALGYTIRIMGPHEPALSAAPLSAPVGDATPYTEDSEHIPRSATPSELPPSF